MTKKVFKNKNVINAAWLISGRLLNKVVVFLVGLLTARYLGPKNYGLVTYATAYTTFFASLCTLGINAIIIKNFADYPGEEGQAIGTAIGLRAISSFLSAIVIIGIVSVVDRDEPLTICVVALSCIELLFHIFDTFKQWFQSRLESKYVMVATLLATLVASAYKVYILIAEKDVTWFALSLSVDYAVIAICLLAIYKKQKGPRLAFSFPKGKQLLSSSYSFIISGLMVAVYSGTDKLMLKQMLGEEEVSYYALSVSLSMVAAFVLEAIIQSIVPSVIEVYKTDSKLFERRNRQLYAIVFYVSMVFSLFVCVFAKPIVSICYGESYAQMIGPLRIVVWYTVFSYLGGARSVWLVCQNKQNYQNILYAGAAVLNVVLNYMLIPVLGPSGAAIASLVTQIFTTIVLPAIFPPLRANVKLMMEAIALKNVF